MKNVMRIFFFIMGYIFLLAGLWQKNAMWVAFGAFIILDTKLDELEERTR